MLIYMVYFVVTTIYYKSHSVFDFGHFKNVHFGKIQKSLEKYPFFEVCDDNALVHRKSNYWVVMINF